MSNTPDQSNTSNSTPSTTGVVVPPEVWAQMQQLLTMFGPPNTKDPSSAPIVPPSAPSDDSPADNMTSITPIIPHLDEAMTTSSQSISPSNFLSDNNKDITTILNPPLPCKTSETRVMNDNGNNNKSVNNSSQDPAKNKTINDDGIVTNIND
ncbi:hypothetical protein PCANC_11613 [Puccinia coronata f. sp. avenae]|uniref:Uncharacterized protein n=1 Tax=Puccinia coronata f. sp. avenae TaxID=200324 RepID=A0A2N5SVL0_9BASI|nr:hypothetical protein PCANC_11613 [Puccinia coronata f. sp. avenae]